MSRPRVLCVLSSDFGEYVTASLFARAQPFDTHFALPETLARFVPSGAPGHSAYREFGEVSALAASLRPDVVLLASGYLYAVNRIASLEQLSALMEALRRAGAALATTDPWLRVWALRPDSRYAIHSIHRGGIDAALSAKMTALQQALEKRFAAVPHVFAVPLADTGRGWLSFFNPQVAGRAPAQRAEAPEWLFVLSREDYVFLAGFERQAFFAGLERRIRELLAREDNRLRFIAPPEIGRFIAERWPAEPRVCHTPFCDFAAFEGHLRRARIAVYWNIISSSLLYCLYYGVAPVFYGAGHLAKVCPGLQQHAAEHVYRGRPPPLLELGAPLTADADALAREMGIDAWLAATRREYQSSPPPIELLAAIRERA